MARPPPESGSAARRAAAILERAQRRRAEPSGAAVWATLALMLLLYGRFALLAGAGLWEEASAWSLFAMIAVPAWAALVVLAGCSAIVPLERASGTLDALRLTPLAAAIWARAAMRPRLRTALWILAAGAPLYLVPRGGDGIDTLVVNVGVLSTFWRPVIGIIGAVASFTGPSVGEPAGAASFLSFLSGPAALFIDATRLYAFAAIATAVSIRSRTAATALAGSVLFAGIFLLVTVTAEWIGAFMFLLGAGEAGVVLLVLTALVLEGWVGNVYTPRAILRSQLARADERLQALDGAG